MMPSYHAIVLASGNDALAQHCNVEHKALIPIGTGYLVSNLLRYYSASKQIATLGYVGTPPPVIPDIDTASKDSEYRLDWQVAGGATLSSSLQQALAASYRHQSKGDPFLLLSSADMPYLTADVLEQFFYTSATILRKDASIDACYVAVSAAACRRDFPEHKRTTIHVLEGEVTGGNMLVIRRSSLVTLVPWFERAYTKRKNPLALAQLIGWEVVWRLLSRRASLPWLEQRISTLLGIKVKVLLSQEASLASDIDSLEQLQHLLELGARSIELK